MKAFCGSFGILGVRPSHCAQHSMRPLSRVSGALLILHRSPRIHGFGSTRIPWPRLPKAPRSLLSKSSCQFPMPKAPRYCCHRVAVSSQTSVACLELVSRALSSQLPPTRHVRCSPTWHIRCNLIRYFCSTLWHWHVQFCPQDDTVPTNER